MLNSFRFGNLKTIQLAECTKVPPIMIIAGINGVGKSTLLHAIKTRKGNVDVTGKIIYMPPHRVWSSQRIQAMYLWEARRTYRDAIETDSLDGTQAIRINSGARTAESADESSKFIKYSLGQIEVQRQNAITKIHDDKSGIEFPDIYQPLKELTKTLLPHLEFYKISLDDKTNIKCLWKRAEGIDLSIGTSSDVDIDELSSGEKAIMTLFLPFIEYQIELKLKSVETTSSPETQTDLVVLIDEPELHLHPILEGRVLSYIRNIVSKEKVQFVITTHSPVLLNNATFEELFLLSPKTVDGVNQLTRLVDEDSRLEALRTLCGDTYSLTALRNIVCIEGESPLDMQKKPTDKKLLEILCPNISKNILIPFGGKHLVIQGARRLRENLPPSINKTKVFALIDKDQDQNITDDWVFRLPVCMIENVLLKPNVINEFLEKYRENTPLKTVTDIETALKEIIQNLRDDEIRIRIKQKIGFIDESIDGITVEELKTSHQKIMESIKTRMPQDHELDTIVKNATTEVDTIISQHKELESFRGKEVLRKFFDKHIQPIGISYYVFCMELAKLLSTKTEHIKDLQDIINAINSKV
ncbi:MAG: AAA family ATPase [Candidatus Nitrosotalea sp.]|nr:AAA family ATPase [Candidatus Nitrosotalea sp.]